MTRLPYIEFGYLLLVAIAYHHLGKALLLLAAFVIVIHFWSSLPPHRLVLVRFPARTIRARGRRW